MAAEAAQSQGARVLILARGMGSLPLTSGCIDGLGYFPGDSMVPLSSPLSALAQLCSNHPQHPYAKVGSERILSALAHFQDICRSMGMPYTGNFASNFLLPTSVGTFHPTCLIPETVKGGDLSISGSVFLLGLEGFRDFSPYFAAENLNILYCRGKIASSFRAGVLGRPDLAGKAINSLTLAKAFDEECFREKFARQARPFLHPGDKLGVPAVLGFHSSLEAWTDLEEKMGTQVFEVPTPPPSVPGIRLYNLLKIHLQGRGVRQVVGPRLLKPNVQFRRLEGFSLGDSKGSPVYKASAFVLATGKFVGGGLDSERGRIYETLLGLPVRYPLDRKRWFNPRLLAARGQPFNEFGVEVDENLQPVDLRGQVVHSNLFAAGGIIAHADSMSEKSGGGIAISTGSLAGSLAAIFASSNKLTAEDAEKI